MFKNNKLLLLLLAVFVNQLVWSMFLPLWQSPDEQAHFGQVQNFAETGKSQITDGKNTSEEIYQSEKFLGTLRDSHGNNAYTYHPDFNVSYSNNTTGVHEKELFSLGNKSRRKFVIRESTGYPPFYYFLGTVFYKAAYGGSIIDRVFAVRLLSIIIALGIVYLTFITSKKAFGNDNFSLVITVMVGFQPMLTFVNSGVTSDGLFNLLFLLFLYGCLTILQDGLKVKSTIHLLLAIVLGFLTKPQANIMFFVLVPVIIISGIRFLKNDWKSISPKSKLIILLSLILVVATVSREIIWRILDGSLFPESSGAVSLTSVSKLPEHLSFTINHTYREVLPWFWGVFRWLSLALPAEIRRVTNWLAILSFIGFALYLVRSILEKKLDRKFWALVFLAFSLVTYFSAITLFDFGFRLGSGFSFGIQGRYFFPVVVPFMAIFLIGLQSLVPRKWHLSVAKVLAISMIALNVFVFFYLMGSYYKLFFPTFFLEASQYKPILFKYPINLIVLIANLGFLSFFSLKLLTQKEK